MDPNNNQPINTNPFGQTTAPQPAVPEPVTAPLNPSVSPQQPAQPIPIPTVTPSGAPTPFPQAPKSGGKKGITLLVILLILAIGMGTYVLFAKNQLNNKQKTANESTSIVIPTIEPTAAPATIEEINIASPDADLNGIEADLQGL